MILRAVIILVAAAALFAACGRRGSLEAPGEPQPAPVPGSTLLLDPVSPGAQEPPGTGSEPVPDRRFILDPLI
jgi:hypothetical protein